MLIERTVRHHVFTAGSVITVLKHFIHSYEVRYINYGSRLSSQCKPDKSFNLLCECLCVSSHGYASLILILSNSNTVFSVYLQLFSILPGFFQQVYNLRVVTLKVRFPLGFKFQHSLFWLVTQSKWIIFFRTNTMREPEFWIWCLINIDEFPMKLYLSNSNTVFPVYLQLRHASEGERKALEGQPHSWE